LDGSKKKSASIHSGGENREGGNKGGIFFTLNNDHFTNGPTRYRERFPPKKENKVGPWSGEGNRKAEPKARVLSLW